MAFQSGLPEPVEQHEELSADEIKALVIRRGGKESVRMAVTDVLWLAKVAKREPMLTAATRIARCGMGAVDHVLWMADNTMKLVIKSKENNKQKRIRE